ncbi:EscU/YscU/HrcU family type III secretion system export apparatus switch protein [Anaplasmataceae bacterium AB001_6]|nr:EscU/YscU/HrcU family type III secretion system export apparatus switch protein [Anaplasmataceae bacterium AB001_6]
MVDEHSKTEKPTKFRLKEERKKGNVPFSKELSLGMMILIYSIIIYFFLRHIVDHIIVLLRSIIEFSYMVDQIDIRYLVFDIFAQIFSILLFPLCLLFIFGLFGGFVQNGFVFSFHNLKPKLKKLSLKEGVSRLFSKESLKNTIISVIKIAFLSVILYLSIKNQLPLLFNISSSLYINDNLSLLSLSIKKMMLYIVYFMIFTSIVDLIITRKLYVDKLKMSKKEIKDELKRQEGDPKIKLKLKNKQKKLINEIIKSIGSADFIVVNPEHYAVALKYDSEKMYAPRIVLKGIDQTALIIKNLAINKNIPIFEDKKLARALYDNTKIGEYIPEEYYIAIAKIIRSIKKYQEI